MVKRCHKCNTEKDIGEFHLQKNSKDGRHLWCKECVYQHNKEYYTKNREKVIDGSRKWQRENKDKVNAKNKRWRELHPEYKNPWGENNQDYYTAYFKQYNQQPNIKINHRMRVYIGRILRSKKEHKNGRSWTKLVGYTSMELIMHLESKFQPGMNWENHGEWHIDHIIPVSAFNFETPDDIDFKRCWALKNLRPLWGDENMKKGAKLLKPFQPSLAINSKA